MKFSVNKLRDNNTNILKNPMEVLDELNTDIKFFKESNDNLVKENLELVKINRELNNRLNEFNVRELECEIHKLKDENNLLLNENNDLKSRALVNPRKVTDEQVLNIKELRKNGLSFRAIAKATGLSTCTITRALNGKYDN
ncbi:MAG: helix-turn-helix domain-containing protein [Clostridia bacterium]